MFQSFGGIGSPLYNPTFAFTGAKKLIAASSICATNPGKYLKITAGISFAISKPREQTNMASRSIGCVVRLRVRILTPNSRQRVEEFCSQEELAGATWQAMQRDLGCYLA